ncbi:helix-turn-helix domain-containing protein [Sporomusa paucivorans]|uniref:helix-turn-helix domain-containing protein n=1 Tax=Sporomusa paucivorans TaxID=2376 RepID=UPI003570BB93
MEETRKVYENVERVRAVMGVTKKHIADKLGLSLQGYRHIASGGVALDVERLKIISEALGVSVDIFFNDRLTDSVIKNMESIGKKRDNKQPNQLQQTG